jgi:hypothetical protein
MNSTALRIAVKAELRNFGVSECHTCALIIMLIRIR